MLLLGVTMLWATLAGLSLTLSRYAPSTILANHVRRLADDPEIYLVECRRLPGLEDAAKPGETAWLLRWRQRNSEGHWRKREWLYWLKGDVVVWDRQVLDSDLK